MMEDCLNDIEFLNKIMFADEATFATNGEVSLLNPIFINNWKRQYTQKVNVRCGILNTRIICLFFFFDKYMKHAKVFNFLTTKLMDVIDDLPLSKMRTVFTT